MKKYELWKDYDGCGYTFIPFDHRQRSSLTKGSRLVWTCSAGHGMRHASSRMNTWVLNCTSPWNERL